MHTTGKDGAEGDPQEHHGLSLIHISALIKVAGTAVIQKFFFSMYLFKEKKNYWITAVPATFMSAVSATYFVLAPECLGGLLNHKTAEGAIVYNTAVAYPVGILFAIAMLALFLYATKKQTVKKTA